MSHYHCRRGIREELGHATREVSRFEVEHRYGANVQMTIPAEDSAESSVGRRVGFLLANGRYDVARDALNEAITYFESPKSLIDILDELEARQSVASDLAYMGIHAIEDLQRLTRGDLLNVDQVGPLLVDRLESELQSRGLALKSS